MYCKRCGTELPDDSKFCKRCGAPQDENIESRPNMTYTAPAEKNKTHFAFALVMLIIAALFQLWLAMPTAIVGFVLALVSQSAYNKGNIADGKKYGKIALIFAWITFAVVIISIIIAIVMVAKLMPVIYKIIETYPESDWYNEIYKALMGSYAL